MKKIISVLMAVMMSVAVCTFSVTPALAVWYGSLESDTQYIEIDITVDGIDSIYGQYEDLSQAEKDKGYDAVINFTYSGKSEVTKWEIKDLVLNVDYVIIEQTDTTIKIALLKDTITCVHVNAVTKDPEKRTTIKNPDKSKTSPKTGVELAGVAMVLAGAATLGVARKKR